MAKNSAPVASSGNGASASPTAPVSAEQPESLDQVRDLLFGGQMRIVDTRMRGLEERTSHENSSLRNELTRRIDELEAASKAEFAAHVERLNAERAKRADDLKALGAEFKDALKSLERRHLDFAEATSQADAEVRDAMMKNSAAFSAELARTAERLTNAVERAESSLRADKLNTASLASSLMDMAARLTSNGDAPGSTRP